MKQYQYTAAVPCHFSIGTEDYSLYQGANYALPSDNDFIRSLAAQGLLQESLVTDNKNTEE